MNTEDVPNPQQSRADTDGDKAEKTFKRFLFPFEHFLKFPGETGIKNTYLEGMGLGKKLDRFQSGTTS